MSESKALSPHVSPVQVGALLQPSAPTPAPDDDEGPDLRRVVGAVRRYAALVLAVISVGVAVTLVVARRWQPLYKAGTMIWIASQNEVQGRASLGPIRQDQLLQWESWVDLLRSYAILDPVVQDLRLNVSPRSLADSAMFRAFSTDSAVVGGDYTLAIDKNGGYVLTGRKQAVLETGVLGDSIGQRLGFRWAPPRLDDKFGRKIKFEVVTPRTASERLAKAIDARVDRTGAFVRLELTGPSPTRVAAIVNAISTRYVKVAGDLKRRRLAELTRNLEQQKNEARENLDRAERELAQFRVKSVGQPMPEDKTGTLAPTDPLIVDGAELDRVRRDRKAIAAWLATPSASRSPAGPLISEEGSSAELNAALEELSKKRADLRTMRLRYEDSYSAVQLLLEDVTRLSDIEVPKIVHQLDADLGARERDLSGRVASRSATLRRVPARLLEEARLTRAATLAAELNTTIQQRFQEAMLAQQSSLPDVWVLDAAVPAQLPASDDSKRVLTLGVLVSIGLALCLAIVLDRFDPRVRYPAEVSRKMGLTILGAVPHLRARRQNGAITPDAAEEVTEAMRGVRLALTHSGTMVRPLLLTISSSGPGDGKSFISSNLGVSFALAGFRTLVIDGDLRRGAIHHAFGVERRPGLTEALRGDMTPHAVVQATTFPKLAIIGSGTRTRLAPELLGGPGMERLIESLKPEFDVIICDSPPLSAGVDPYLIASVTHNLLVVLRTGVSIRSVLEAKLAMLSQLPVTLLGAVLNAVPAGSVYQAYSYHVRGYEAVDELEPGAALPTA